ncbi:MAG: tRNA pseudouridine(54/55) synthase Pus10 [Nitrososphaerales archaeon]
MASTVNIAPSILKKYILCTRCLSRQAKEKVSGNIRRKGICYICNGLMERIDDLLELTLAALEEYRYKSFLLGAMVPSQMLEREDEVRSRFKIKGAESIKSYLTKQLGKMLTKKTGKRVDYVKPDVTINIDLVGNKVTVRSKPIHLYGRYVKRARGLSQRQERCGNCMGKGCVKCDNTGLSGLSSIEGIIVRKLIDAFKCERTKFAWVGGEDKDSLVLNKGRPFFVKVINPRLRFAKPRSVTKNGVHVRFIKRVGGLPDKPLRFKTKVRLLAECECNITSAALAKINALNNTAISFLGKHGREVSRNIYEISAKASGNTLNLMMLADGGFAIKQFVGGDGIAPSISQIVGSKVICKSFDVLDVKFTD